jgi:hypothetical protein
MPGDRHLHIDDRDALADWMSTALGSARSGAITIDFEGEPAVQIAAVDGQIAVNLLQPSLFSIPEDETGLFDKVKTASEFGRRLSDRGVTLYFLRKGKEAVRLGRDARPVFSKLVTGSGDIQLSSVRELAKLKGDLKSD